MDKYIFIKNLGKGTFGVVKLYENKITGEKVAVKEVSKYMLTSKAAKQSILNEISILEDISNRNTKCEPNIVCIYEVIESSDYYWIITEYIEGYTLAEIFRNGYTQNLDFKIKDAKLSINLTSYKLLKWMRKITKAVIYIHEKGYAHKDLKPANIMITIEGKVKIIDLGMSCKNNVDYKTDPKGCSTNIRGTPNYLAPEVFLRKLKIDGNFQTDIYALGATFYFMATNEMLYPSTKTSQFIAKIESKDRAPIDSGDKIFDNLIDQMVSYNPDERPGLLQVLKTLKSITNPYFKRTIFLNFLTNSTS